MKSYRRAVWETADGRLFFDKKAAESHEACLKIFEAIVEFGPVDQAERIALLHNLLSRADVISRNLHQTTCPQEQFP